MAYYRPCPLCGAALDPEERCDCRNTEKAAPVREHQGGIKVESELSEPHSTSKYNSNQGGIQVWILPVLLYLLLFKFSHSSGDCSFWYSDL